MDVIDLYHGNVQLAFDPERHLYRVTDPAHNLHHARLPSVTAVLGVINKPALVGWAANMAAGWFRDNMEPGRAYTEVEIADMVRQARRAHTARKEKSADEGTIIHKYIEDYINYRLGNRETPPDPPLEPRLFTAIDGFHKWEEQHHVEFILSEQRIYSRSFKVVGTADILMRVDGELTIGDIKTGKYVYPEYGLQLAAYAYALVEQGSAEDTIKKGIIIRIGREGTGVEVAELLTDEQTWADHIIAFDGARKLYDWKEKYGG